MTVCESRIGDRETDGGSASGVRNVTTCPQGTGSAGADRYASIVRDPQQRLAIADGIDRLHAQLDAAAAG
ncbi:MAG: hypothetical protein DWP92_11540 [Armatimonadetes bacterium]|nr:MAG: hypothetical protein DWP92_11540 [Armatimonadota bacterium]